MSRPRILFVDDESNVLDALQRSLRTRSAHWEMVFATSPGRALELQKQTPFDVAVVDMRMPDMTGIELIKALKALPGDTVAMMLTGATDINAAIAAINEASVFRFYAKPCAADVLASGIEQALAQRAPQAAAAPPSLQASIGLATLDRLPMGVVVVDAAAHILFMNALGAEYLAGKDGLTMTPAGLCRAARQHESTKLHSLVRLCVESEGDLPVRALSISRDEADRPLSVVVAPLPAETGSGRVAVLLINDPGSRNLPSVDTVSKLFDLTEAEARLALALGEGQKIEDAAETLGITLNSARTYLKRIFSKTDVTRQAELVRLIMAAPTLRDLGAGKAALRH